MLRRGVTLPWGEHGSVTQHRALQRAARILQEGGIVAFPTETVYGLGANAWNENACVKIFEAKGRPADNPLIVHIADIGMLETLASYVPPIAYSLAQAFWPGPMTLVLKKVKEVPAIVSGGLDTVAVRFPLHSAATAIIRAAGIPIAAPSANISGRPSPTLAEHVAHDLGGRIDLIIDGGPCLYGIESTIIDVTGDIPCILRPGSITREDILAVTGSVDTDPGISGAPKAPGMKYRHYAPNAHVTVVKGEPLALAITRAASRSPLKTGIMATDQTLNMYESTNALVLSMGDRCSPSAMGAKLYYTLRAFDLNAVEILFAEALPEHGAYAAIMNRLKKAAGNNVVDALKLIDMT